MIKNKIQNDDVNNMEESEAINISKRKFFSLIEQAAKDQEDNAIKDAKLDKMTKDGIQARAQIEEIHIKHINKIKDLENENNKLKKQYEMITNKTKLQSVDIPRCDGNRYHKIKEQELRRLENGPNEWHDFIGKLSKYA